MPAYPNLDALLQRALGEDPSDHFRKHVIPYLLEIWIANYKQQSPGAEIVETTQEQSSYLFDTVGQRLIAAWRISGGRHPHQRDTKRAKKHPMSAGPEYHRGHAISHRLGGRNDINLVPQRGKINNGAFKKLETMAVKTPGALYYTYWMYGDSESQTPVSVEQALLVPGEKPKFSIQGN